jgi:excisionase family DNA binding protein
MALTDAEPRALLTVDEAAQRLRVHPMTIRRMIRDGRIAAVQLGGPHAPIRIPIDPLEAWLFSQPERAA